MRTLAQIIDAYTDAHAESYQLGYEQGDSNWIDSPTVWGSDIAW